jgi:hypothetical protein
MPSVYSRFTGAGENDPNEALGSLGLITLANMQQALVSAATEIAGNPVRYSMMLYNIMYSAYTMGTDPSFASGSRLAFDVILLMQAIKLTPNSIMGFDLYGMLAPRLGLLFVGLSDNAQSFWKQLFGDTEIVSHEAFDPKVIVKLVMVLLTIAGMMFTTTTDITRKCSSLLKTAASNLNSVEVFWKQLISHFFDDEVTSTLDELAVDEHLLQEFTSSTQRDAVENVIHYGELIALCREKADRLSRVADAPDLKNAIQRFNRRITTANDHLTEIKVMIKTSKWPRPHPVNLHLCGPPAAGKTHYINEKLIPALIARHGWTEGTGTYNVSCSVKHFPPYTNEKFFVADELFSMSTDSALLGEFNMLNTNQPGVINGAAISAKNMMPLHRYFLGISNFHSFAVGATHPMTNAVNAINSRLNRVLMIMPTYDANVERTEQDRTQTPDFYRIPSTSRHMPRVNNVADNHQRIQADWVKMSHEEIVEMLYNKQRRHETDYEEKTNALTQHESTARKLPFTWLLVGPTGTGKTLKLANIAGELGLNGFTFGDNISDNVTSVDDMLPDNQLGYRHIMDTKNGGVVIGGMNAHYYTWRRPWLSLIAMLTVLSMNVYSAPLVMGGMLGMLYHWKYGSVWRYWPELHSRVLRRTALDGTNFGSDWNGTTGQSPGRVTFVPEPNKFIDTMGIVDDDDVQMTCANMQNTEDGHCIIIAPHGESAPPADTEVAIQNMYAIGNPTIQGANPAPTPREVLTMLALIRNTRNTDPYVLHSVLLQLHALNRANVRNMTMSITEIESGVTLRYDGTAWTFYYSGPIPARDDIMARVRQGELQYPLVRTLYCEVYDLHVPTMDIAQLAAARRVAIADAPENQKFTKSWILLYGAVTALGVTAVAAAAYMTWKKTSTTVKTAINTKGVSFLDYLRQNPDFKKHAIRTLHQSYQPPDEELGAYYGVHARQRIDKRGARDQRKQDMYEDWDIYDSHEGGMLKEDEQKLIDLLAQQREGPQQTIQRKMEKNRVTVFGSGSLTGWILKGHMGIAPAHILVEGARSVTVIKDHRTYQATIVAKNKGADLFFFELEKTAPMFSNIIHYFIRAEDVDDLAAGVLILPRPAGAEWHYGSLSYRKHGSVLQTQFLANNIVELRFAGGAKMTIRGDCGALYLSNNPKHQTSCIAAMHSIANNQGTLNAGILVTQEIINHVLEPRTHEKSMAVVPCPFIEGNIMEQQLSTVFSDIEKKPEVFTGERIFTLGYSSKARMPHPKGGSSKYKPMPHQTEEVPSKIPALLEFNAIPQETRDTFKRNPNGVLDRAFTMLAKNDKPLTTLPYMLYQHVGTTYSNWWCQMFEPGEIRKLTRHEMVNGVIRGPLRGKIQSFDMSTAAGFEMAKIFNVTKKENLFDQQGGIWHWKKEHPGTVYIHSYLDYLEDHPGAKFTWAVNGTLKDELLPMEKVRDEGKIRLFQSVGFARLCATKLYIGCLVGAVQNHILEITHTSGIDPIRDFSMLRSHFGECDWLLTFDFKAWDKQVPKEAMELWGKAAENLFSMHYEENDFKNASAQLAGLIEHVETNNGWILLYAVGVISGDYYTNTGNSGYNDIVTMTAIIYLIYRKTAILMSVSEFMEVFRFVTHGDDGLLGGPPEYRWITFSLIKDAISQLWGMNITPGCKDAAEQDHETLAQVTFLKRSFSNLDGVTVGRLDPASIEQQINWSRSDQTDHLVQLWSNALQEACLWSEVYYQHLAKTVHLNAKAFGIKFPVVPYTEARLLVKRRIGVVDKCGFWEPTDSVDSERVNLIAEKRESISKPESPDKKESQTTESPDKRESIQTAQIQHERKMPDFRDYYGILRCQCGIILPWNPDNIRYHRTTCKRTIDHEITSLVTCLAAWSLHPPVAMEGTIQAHIYDTEQHSAAVRHFVDRMKGKLAFHDASKFSLEEIIGYTIQFFLASFGSIDTPLWQYAIQHHYLHNDHHPEFNIALWDTEGAFNHIPVKEVVADMMACLWRLKPQLTENELAVKLYKEYEDPTNKYSIKMRQALPGLLTVLRMHIKENNFPDEVLHLKTISITRTAYTCPYCAVGIEDPIGFSNHMRNSHNIAKPFRVAENLDACLDTASYQCNLCSYATTTARKARNHFNNTHRGKLYDISIIVHGHESGSGGALPGGINQQPSLGITTTSNKTATPLIGTVGGVPRAVAMLGGYMTTLQDLLQQKIQAATATITNAEASGSTIFDFEYGDQQWSNEHLAYINQHRYMQGDQLIEVKFLGAANFVGNAIVGTYPPGPKPTSITQLQRYQNWVSVNFGQSAEACLIVGPNTTTMKMIEVGATDMGGVICFVEGALANSLGTGEAVLQVIVFRSFSPEGGVYWPQEPSEVFRSTAGITTSSNFTLSELFSPSGSLSVNLMTDGQYTIPYEHTLTASAVTWYDLQDTPHYHGSAQQVFGQNDETSNIFTAAFGDINPLARGPWTFLNTDMTDALPWDYYWALQGTWPETAGGYAIEVQYIAGIVDARYVEACMVKTEGGQIISMEDGIEALKQCNAVAPRVHDVSVIGDLDGYSKITTGMKRFTLSTIRKPTTTNTGQGQKYPLAGRTQAEDAICTRVRQAMGGVSGKFLMSITGGSPLELRYNVRTHSLEVNSFLDYAVGTVNSDDVTFTNFVPEETLSLPKRDRSAIFTDLTASHEASAGIAMAGIAAGSQTASTAMSTGGSIFNASKNREHEKEMLGLQQAFTADQLTRSRLTTIGLTKLGANIQLDFARQANIYAKEQAQHAQGLTNANLVTSTSATSGYLGASPGDSTSSSVPDVQLDPPTTPPAPPGALERDTSHDQDLDLWGTPAVQGANTGLTVIDDDEPAADTFLPTEAPSNTGAPEGSKAEEAEKNASTPVSNDTGATGQTPIGGATTTTTEV